ncbi:MAG: hypothetical protein RJA07_2501 [Bacteroidota bacterium]|jgi:hypothetical protein
MELLVTSIEQFKLAKMSAILTEHGIESDFSSDTLTIGDSFTSKPIYQYHLYVDAKNLEQANYLLIKSKIFEEELNEQFEDVDFEDDEIDETQTNTDGYSKGRNIGTLDDFDLPTSENINGGYEKGKSYLIVVGYISSILGGIFGIMLGSSYYYLKSTNKDGNSKYIYDINTRKHGLFMILIGSFVILCSIIYFLFKLISNI